VFFLAILIKLYWIVPIAAVGIAILAWRWAWVLGHRETVGDVDIGHGERAATHPECDDRPGWWGSVFLLVADGTFFASLLFGYAFLWTIAPNWPPPALIEPSLVGMVLGLGAALAAGAVRGKRFAETKALAGTAAGLAVAASVLIYALVRAPSPTDHAYGAVLAVLGSYALLHLFIAALMIGFVWMRARAGRPESGLRSERRIVRLWTDYAALVTAAAVLAIELPPCCAPVPA